MVEEFMLKANEIVAQHLSERGEPLTYRIHEEPSEENLRDFSALVAAFGFDLPEKPSYQDLQQLFDEAASTPYGQHLAISYIRKMKMAYYSPNNIGHYGLSLEHYCHFTSPIRRYVDIVAHRLLFNEKVDIETVQTISEICSEQERISAKAENSVRLLKKLRLLKQWQKEDPYREYEAVITQVKPFGIIIEIVELMLDGFIHVSEMGGDYFVYDEHTQKLIGDHSGYSFQAGERLVVQLREIDFLQSETRWALVFEEDRKRQSKRKKKKCERGE